MVSRVRRCIDAGIIEGDQADIAHGLYALAQGLAMQEAAGRLGSSRASVNRRWDLTIRAFLVGLGPPHQCGSSSRQDGPVTGRP